MKTWRNYHAEAVKPPAPPRTRAAIAARNRSMQAINRALRLTLLKPITAAGKVKEDA